MGDLHTVYSVQMVMPQMKTHDRKTSKCRSHDLRGSAKKGGAGGKGAWGKYGDELVDIELDQRDPAYDPVEDRKDTLIVTYVEHPFPPLSGTVDLIEESEACAMSPCGQPELNFEK